MALLAIVYLRERLWESSQKKSSDFCKQNKRRKKSNQTFFGTNRTNKVNWRKFQSRQSFWRKKKLWTVFHKSQRRDNISLVNPLRRKSKITSVKKIWQTFSVRYESIGVIYDLQIYATRSSESYRILLLWFYPK